MRADEKLTAFLELESAIRERSLGCTDFANSPDCPRQLAKHRKQRLPRRIYETTKTLATQFPPQGSQAKQTETEQRNCRAAIRDTRTRHPIWSVKFWFASPVPHVHT